MKTLQDITIDQKIVLLRVDFNVPIDKATGAVSDTSRIEAAKPTIDYLRQHNAKVVLLAHFGRPKGQVVKKLRFKPLVATISEVLDTTVEYVDDCIGDKPQQAIQALPNGGVLLLENIRFYPGEEANDEDFTKELASLGDVYVNDAFGAAHRAHASTVGLANILPHAAGLLLQREVEELQRVTHNPTGPVVAIIGGAKISTKINLIAQLLPKVDYMLLGGALANTVLLAQEYPVGKSLVEAELTAMVKDILSNKLKIPVDVIAAKAIEDKAQCTIKAVGEVGQDEYIVDIGPDTITLYTEIITQAKTIIWNGPMGVFEMSSFAAGTFKVAEAVAQSEAYSVIGGGETVSAVNQLGVEEKISFISTGGGAMLEFLEGKNLPGVAALA